MAGVPDIESRWEHRPEDAPLEDIHAWSVSQQEDESWGLHEEQKTDGIRRQIDDLWDEHSPNVDAMREYKSALRDPEGFADLTSGLTLKEISKLTMIERSRIVMPMLGELTRKHLEDMREVTFCGGDSSQLDRDTLYSELYNILPPDYRGAWDRPTQIVD